eukprot:CAMPEP_0174240540 /NCGR_PEP_ID=MMETSP0417-20130205/19285_1 /TAXON_ID=242541 /ORGANISM="Mayorella sp, Strain BSH-02190019" /LENGTH=264 /DNA_ID=CAMNT_0015319643 /DNA_START=200 /DNA_END=994 /DNA_ORIENTATION=+
MLWRLLALALAMLLCVNAVVSSESGVQVEDDAEDDLFLDDEDHPAEAQQADPQVGSGWEDALTDEQSEEFQEISESQFVRTAAVFPDSATQEVAIGEIGELLVGFSNNGPYRFNLTHISGSLLHPQDLSFVMQNFTARNPDLVVGPGEHRSLSYRFKPDEMLEARDYGFTVTLYYHDGTTYHRNVVYNGTIIIAEEAAAASQTITGVAVAVGFVVALYLFVGRNSSQKGSRGVETGTDGGNDYLTHLKESQKKKNTPQRKGRKA